jgi:uncharacterized membrane protein YfcA
MELTPLQYLLSAAAGLVVGFSLGLVGGGGSILAVPLLLYMVGLEKAPDAAHIAVGTTALAVGLNAYINSLIHLKKRNVDLKTGAVFAAAGLAGSAAGAYLGHITPGTRLLALFAVFMIAVGASMALPTKTHRNAPRRSTPKTAAAGILVGFLSGYFGIGGGFLIVPTLMYVAGLEISKAVGTSLISVGTFGLATGLIYALYGKTLVAIAALYLIGGVAGGYLGAALALKTPRDTLKKIYSALIIAVGIYILYKSLGA